MDENYAAAQKMKSVDAAADIEGETLRNHLRAIANYLLDARSVLDDLNRKVHTINHTTEPEQPLAPIESEPCLMEMAQRIKTLSVEVRDSVQLLYRNIG